MTLPLSSKASPSRPAEMAFTPLSPVTAAGVRSGSHPHRLAPSPSSPDSFSPQASTVPFSSKASPKPSPVPIAATPLSPPTCAGTPRFNAPNPRALLPLSPTPMTALALADPAVTKLAASTQAKQTAPITARGSRGPPPRVHDSSPRPLAGALRVTTRTRRPTVVTVVRFLRTFTPRPPDSLRRSCSVTVRQVARCVRDNADSLARKAAVRWRRPLVADAAAGGSHAGTPEHGAHHKSVASLHARHHASCPLC